MWCSFPYGYVIINPKQKCVKKSVAYGNYAVITVYDSFAAAFERIPNAYKKIMEYLQENGFREKPREGILSCFEHVYEKDGITCMDVYIHVDGVSKTDSFMNFS